MRRYQYEKRYLRAGLEQIKPYLLANELFWNLGLANPKERPPYPQLTLGNLLLSAHILGCVDAEAKELAKLDKERREWASAWRVKAARDYEYRLNQWNQTVEDFSQDGSFSEFALATEVRNRALLELLGAELGADERAGLGSPASADTRLRRFTQSGEFLWDAEVEDCFGAERYWFLYSQPS